MGTLCLAILTLLFARNLVVLLAARIPANPSAAVPGDRAFELQKRLDPNLAPWWELAQLPGIGPVTAQRIIAHRETAPPPAFQYLADLDLIKNIGPATLRMIEPYLSFPSLPKNP
jgi:DNA uptake protein ComE-like DNA-binding protein